MNNLKDLTHEQHKNAERSLFVKKLLKKEITPYQYYIYLCNQFLMYTTLEGYALEIGVLDGIEEIKRGTSIAKDLQELEKEYGFEIPVHLKSTGNYIQYIRKISEDSEKLLAHIYVRHMGDLSGGQIIKRFVPGSGNHYHFETDVNELKERVRAKLHDGLAEEAKVCFAMIKEFMEELESSLDMGQSD
jgi:heme oxygenase (biliverdin-producing, ferredoxin)